MSALELYVDGILRRDARFPGTVRADVLIVQDEDREQAADILAEASAMALDDNDLNARESLAKLSDRVRS